MDHHSTGVHAVLERPSAYERLQQVLGAKAARKRFAEEFLRPFAGARLLDIGCGTGSLLDDLPPGVDYFGFDVNQSYIEAARKRHGTRGRFFCAAVGEEPDVVENESFDLVVARGVLHHLSDDDVRHLLGVARRCLRPGGAFVSSDPTRHEGQSRVARLLIALDRGRNVRTPDGYRQLLNEHFAKAETWLITDLLRVPYSHHIARATKTP
jgi:SAM-dependent methyltransferase